MNKNKEYYYLDIDLGTLKVVAHGVSLTATLTGNTENESVHRVFLTKGQYQKFIGKL
jgi:hypothetical protein